MTQQCPDGRWFCFSLAMDSLVILEKKGIPEHLLQLNVLDRPTFLKKIISEMEDMGEASISIKIFQNFRSKYCMSAIYFQTSLNWNADQQSCLPTFPFEGGDQNIPPQDVHGCPSHLLRQASHLCARWAQRGRWWGAWWRGQKVKETEKEKQENQIPTINQKLWIESFRQQAEVIFQDVDRLALQARHWLAIHVVIWYKKKSIGNSFA